MGKRGFRWTQVNRQPVVGGGWAISLLLAAWALGGCGGVGPALPPPSGLLPAPRGLRMVAVSLSDAAYRWLAALPPSSASPVATIPASRAREEGLRAGWEGLPRPGRGQDRKAGGMTSYLLGAESRYVELRWQWPDPQQTPVDRFLWARTGGTQHAVPGSEGVRLSGSRGLTFRCVDSAMDIVAGSEGSEVSYSVRAQRGELLGPPATVRGKVLPTLTDPTLREPADQVEIPATALPVLRWQGDRQADGYQVEVVDAATGGVMGTWFTTATSLDLGGLSPTSGNWTAGAAYRWRVLAVRTIPMFSPERTDYEAVSLSLSLSRQFRLRTP